MSISAALFTSPVDLVSLPELWGTYSRRRRRPTPSSQMGVSSWGSVFFGFSLIWDLHITLTSQEQQFCSNHLCSKSVRERNKWLKFVREFCLIPGVLFLWSFDLQIKITMKKKNKQIILWKISVLFKNPRQLFSSKERNGIFP